MNVTLFSQVTTLKESIYFGLGKTSLTAQHKAKLDSILLLLKASSSYAGEIKGYTCNLGSVSINKMISNLRALNVYNYIIDKGAKKENLTYIGLGSKNPTGNNQTNAGRILNRRADIELLLDLLDAPDQPISQSTTKSKNSIKTSGNQRVLSEYTGYVKDYSNSQAGNKTVNNANNKSEINSTNQSKNSGVVEESVNAIFQPSSTVGPEFSSGKIPAAGNIRIQATNGIVMDIDKNTFVTASKEAIEVDFKDYTKNYEIMRKGLKTKSGNKDYKMLGAFNINFTQEYQDLSINAGKPLKVYIPGDYDPNIELYTNSKNWTIDTINKLSYDDEKQAYEVIVIKNTDMISLMKPASEISDTLKYLCVKIKGLNPEYIKPYVIYDDCTISQGVRLKGKKFIFPITKLSSTYRLRAAYTDYSGNGEAYSLNFDVVNLSPTSPKMTPPKNMDIVILKLPTKIEMKKGKLHLSSLCEMNTQTEITK